MMLKICGVFVSGAIGTSVRTVFWQHAPDKRMLRTLDWINDECESRLGREDRPQDGRITYAALMSPLKVEIWNPRVKRYRGFEWPVSLLITDDLLLIGTKRGRGRRAGVKKIRRERAAPAGVKHAPVKFTFASNDEVAALDTLVNGICAERAPLKGLDR
jgi:hypothetical protein